MDPEIYDELLAQEKVHWWWLARRRVILSLLKRLKLNSKAKILDAGCGSGGNLPMLSRLGGELYAFEMYEKARKNAQLLGLATIEAGSLPDAIPFPGISFDLIALMDVLEHVADDKAALDALAARLKPGGVICINVPAFQWLFARHDRLHHHFRRYNKTELVRLVQNANLSVEFVSYWNFFLFPAATIARLIDFMGFTKDHAIGAGTPGPFLNSLLYKLSSSERLLLPHIRFPFGLSLVVLARKPVQ